jgi:geranylgeranyl diphosphate synthase, type II
MAGPMDKYEELVPSFCRHLGVGFQVLNDLKDWRGDSNNKLLSGQDAQALRPTVMLALAIDAATPEQKAELQEIIDMPATDEFRGPRLKRLFEDTGVFEKADALVEKSRARAETLADNVENEKLRQLLYFLVDTVLAPEDDQQPTIEPSPVMFSLPVA